MSSDTPVVADNEDGLRWVEGEAREVRLADHLLDAQRRVRVRRQVEHVHLGQQRTRHGNRHDGVGSGSVYAANGLDQSMRL